MNKTVRIANGSVRVDFMCTADEASSYYWLKENGNISSNAEGINTNNLLLRNILPSDSGHYQCVAVNENGMSYSNYATLTVEGNDYSCYLFITTCMHFTVLPPEVNITPAEVQTTEGETVNFSCIARGLGDNNFTYQWFLNDFPVAGQATAKLIINDVSIEDTGDYTCFVKNPYGGISQSEIARLILGI